VHYGKCAIYRILSKHSFMKKYLLLLCAIVAQIVVSAQQPKLTPAQQQHRDKLLKQAEAQMDKYASELLSETVFGAPKLPALNNQQLNLIPAEPLTESKLTESLQKFQAALQLKLDAGMVQDVKRLTQQFSNDTGKASVYQLLALREYLRQNLGAALLLQSEAVLATSNNDLELINFTGYLNIAGLPHASVTIFESMLKNRPAAVNTSSAALNNYAHALLSLGKTEQAITYYNKCLAIDPKHPEAHAAMGNIHWAKGKPMMAAASFSKSLAVRYCGTEAQSITKIAETEGKDVHEIVKWNEISYNKREYYGVPHMNITLEKSLLDIIQKMPPVPRSNAELLATGPAFSTYIQNMSKLAAKLMTPLTPQQVKYDAESFLNNKRSSEVDHAVDALAVEYGFLLNPAYFIDVNYMVEMTNTYAQARKAESDKGNNCPTAVIDQFVGKRNEYYKTLLDKGVPLWKQYLHALAAEYGKQPTYGRQFHLNVMLANYVLFVSMYSQFVSYHDENGIPSMGDIPCTPRTQQEIDAALAWENFLLKCRHPEIQVKIGKFMSATMEDCKDLSFQLAIPVGAISPTVRISKTVGTGKSTVFLGATASSPFAMGIAEAGVGAGAIVSFEGSGTPSDLGIQVEASAGVSLPGGSNTSMSAGVKAEATYTINSGFNAGWKATGIGDINSLSLK
jgi:tetratricopeptide (TPR) repeat protein